MLENRMRKALTDGLGIARGSDAIVTRASSVDMGRA